MAFPIVPVLSGIAGLGAGAGLMGALSGSKKKKLNTPRLNITHLQYLKHSN